VKAAREAGACLTGYFGKLDPSWVSEKAQNDVVSRADRESEEICRHILLDAFPGDRFLGEETGASDGDADAPSWIVDPLDGTANFVRGFPHWAVSIARTERGLTGPLTVGVVWDPVKNDLFVAERGGGAFRNGERVTVPARAGFEGAALATGFPFRNRSRIDAYLAIFKAVFLEVRSLRRAGARPWTWPTSPAASSTASSSSGCRPGTPPRARCSSRRPVVW